MINKEFLKTLRVLYAEDNIDISNSLSAVLKKVFKELIVCQDGQEGIDKFISYTVEQNKDIDLIISDMNMPNKNGLEMVEAVRDINNNVPIIFTTAHSESEFLLKAIELNVSRYVMKPVNMANLLGEVQNICFAQYRQKLVLQKDKELQAYIDIMNNIATIQKTNEVGDILYANKLLCKISHYDKNEILKLNIKDIMHPDIIQTTYQNIQESILKDEIWEGICKFIDKNKELFYLHLFVVPQFYGDKNNEATGYTLVGFISTEDELKKQDTMKKVRLNIMNSKKKEMKLKNKIKKLENELSLQNTPANSTGIQNDLKHYKSMTAQLKSEVKNYREDIDNLNKLIEAQKTKVAELSKANIQIQDKLKFTKENLIIANSKLK